jgi:hypothetical protein
MSNAFRVGVSLPIVAAYLVLAAASEPASQANCKVGDVSVEPDVVILDGPDAGFKVSFPIENAGKDGTVSIKVRLSTSEGTFERQQDLSLSAGASRQLAYSFHEPTINATNVQAIVNCTP